MKLKVSYSLLNMTFETLDVNWTDNGNSDETQKATVAVHGATANSGLSFIVHCMNFHSFNKSCLLILWHE